MATNLDGLGTLRPESGTLSPLPDYHRRGLLAVTILGILSFVTSTGLFLYIAYKFAKWRFQPSMTPGQQEQENSTSNDLSLGLAQKNFGNGPPKPTASEDVRELQLQLQHHHQQQQQLEQEQQQQQQQRSVKKGAPNQILILIFNLLLADMHQATAFMLSARWVRINEITVGTRTCWTQGWFVSTGDLASSCFTGAVAIYTYLVIVKNWKPSYRLLYAAIASIWIFVYLMAVLGVAITQNGRDKGGLYVRAAAWCWVSIDYENYRLWLHYFWMFLSLGLTTILYGLTFYHLRPRPSSASQSSSGRQQQDGDRRPCAQSGSHPAFLIYPLIYVSCTAPLALGRIVTMTGTNVSIPYFLVAGGLIASNGWLDVLLFSTTRHTVIFDRPADSEDTGVGTFTFMRTPHNRQYGNMVWVQGGITNDAPEEAPRGRRRNGTTGWEKIGDRIGWGNRRTHYKGPSRDWVSGPSSMSQESLRGGYMTDGGIQLDTVTTVVVEVEQDKKQSYSRAESAFSGDDTDKTVEPQARSL